MIGDDQVDGPHGLFVDWHQDLSDTLGDAVAAANPPDGFDIDSDEPGCPADGPL